MQIYLPVHQTTGCEKVFDRIDAFGFNNEVVIGHIKHLDDTGRTDVPLCDTGIETVTSQIVQTVHVELPTDELVKETFGIFVFEYLDGKAELPVHFFVHAFHKHEGNLFVRYILHDSIFEYM